MAIIGEGFGRYYAVYDNTFKKRINTFVTNIGMNDSRYYSVM